MSNYSWTSSITENQITTPRVCNIDIMNFWLHLVNKIICVNFQLPNDIQSYFKELPGATNWKLFARIDIYQFSFYPNVGIAHLTPWLQLNHLKILVTLANYYCIILMHLQPIQLYTIIIIIMRTHCPHSFKYLTVSTLRYNCSLYFYNKV